MPSETTPSFRAAYDLHLPAMRALADDDVLKVNLDIPTAGQTVLGVVSQLASHRAALVALPGVSPAAVDQLESLTRAMVHAHTQWTFASAPVFPIAELIAKGTVQRDKLLAAAGFFAAYNAIEIGKLREIGRGKSHRDLAMDLLGLATLIRPSLDKPEVKAAISSAELDATEALGEHIMVALGERQQSNVTASEASQLRDRAFTLFIGAYDQVQRGMAFLRWQTDDADVFTPSLFGGKRRRGTDKSPDAPKPVGGEGGKDAPVGGNTGGTEPNGPFVNP